MSCEGACAHAHVRCAVARVCVRAKSILKSVRDVRACGSFWACDVRSHFCTLFRKDFARTRSRATAHCTCACAHAPSQLVPCKVAQKPQNCL